MDPLPTDPPPTPTPTPLAYSVDKPRRPTMHLWILAVLAMLAEMPWMYIVGSMLWNGMGTDGGLYSLHGVVAIVGLSFPSLIAAALVIVAIRRS